MVLWNSRRRGKPRDPSRVSAYFSSPKYNDGSEYNDLSTLHGYSAHVTGNIDARRYSTDRTLAENSGRKTSYSASNELHMSDAFAQPTTCSGSVSGKNETRSSVHNDRSNNINTGSGGDGLWSWIPHVSQTADDATISYRVREIFAITEQFVNNFFVERAYTGDILDSTLDVVNCSPLLSTSQLQEHLTRSGRQTALIKHVLASLLLALISFDKFVEQGSLLPKEFQSYTMLTEARTREETSAEDIPHVQPALSSYRILTAYIHSNVENDPEYTEEKRELTDEIVEKFGMAFGHWSNTDTALENRMTALRQLLEKAASLGVFLFSQPSVFYFDWEMTPQDEKALLIPLNPRLLRVFDNEAQLKLVADHLVPMKCARLFSDSTEEERFQQS